MKYSLPQKLALLLLAAFLSPTLAGMPLKQVAASARNPPGGYTGVSPAGKVARIEHAKPAPLSKGKGNSTWARELSRASERSASPAVGTQPIKRTVRRTVSRAVKQIVRRSSAAPTGRCDACAKACRPCCVGGSTFLHAGQCEGCVGCAQCAAAVCAAGTAPPERGSVGPGPTKARGHGARGDSRVAAKVKSTGHQRRRRRGGLKAASEAAGRTATTSAHNPPGGYHGVAPEAKPAAAEHEPTARLKLTVDGPLSSFAEVQGGNGLVAPPQAKKLRSGLAKFMHVPVSAVSTGTADFGVQAASETVIYLTAPAAAVRRFRDAFDDGKASKIGGTTIISVAVVVGPTLPVRKEKPLIDTQSKIIIGVCAGVVLFLSWVEMTSESGGPIFFFS